MGPSLRCKHTKKMERTEFVESQFNIEQLDCICFVLSDTGGKKNKEIFGLSMVIVVAPPSGGIKYYM